MKVLIGNFHNSTFGGGELYTHQCSKAISAFADVLLCHAPNQGLIKNNPTLIHPYRLWNGKESVDAYLNLNHFDSLICNTAKTNIQVTFFPNKDHRVSDYDRFVAICNYSAKYVTEFWNRSALVCEPYSSDIAPGVKVPQTIVSVGNFFREANGHSKNQHQLINAFKRLPSGWKLTLIGGEGNKEYVADCREAANGLNIEIITNADEVTKIKTLQESAFYWHANGYNRTDPYETEHFGIAPVEALKAGCLTYVHASGGAQDFCTSWQTIDELVDMTLRGEPNNPDVKFQTPNGMISDWRNILGA